MTAATPPKGPAPPKERGPLARREARLAWSLMLPTLISVTLVVLLPLLAIFWISAKPVELADLRPPAPVVREDLRDADEAVATLRYRVRNSSQQEVIEDVVLTDTIPEGVAIETLPESCELDGAALRCMLGTLEGGGA
jgi:multiple sugar transport system permease protein